MNYVENMKNIGFSDEIIQKVTEHKDYEAIAKIMDESVSFEDAAARIKKEFPSINMEEVKKNLEEMSKQHGLDIYDTGKNHRGCKTGSENGNFRGKV